MENNNINFTKITTFGELLTTYSPNVFHNSIFNDLEVRIDNYNQCWFVGSKVAERLGYNNPHEAVRYHVSNQYKIKSSNISELSKLLSSGSWHGGRATELQYLYMNVVYMNLL